MYEGSHPFQTLNLLHLVQTFCGKLLYSNVLIDGSTRHLQAILASYDSFKDHKTYQKIYERL